MNSTQDLDEFCNQAIARFRACNESMTPDQLRQREEYRAQLLKEEEAVKRSRYMKFMLEESACPARHVNRESLDGTARKWLDTLERLKARLGSGFLTAVTGIRGNGKTQLGVELIRHNYLSRGKKARFVTALGFVANVRASFRSRSETELDVVEKFRGYPLLVIDEFCQRAETAYEDAMLFELLNHRYNDGRDTLIACNVAPNLVPSTLGPSLSSRLVETGELIDANWPTFRRVHERLAV